MITRDEYRELIGYRERSYRTSEARHDYLVNCALDWRDFGLKQEARAKALEQQAIAKGRMAKRLQTVLQQERARHGESLFQKNRIEALRSTIRMSQRRVRELDAVLLDIGKSAAKLLEGAGLANLVKIYHFLKNLTALTEKETSSGQGRDARSADDGGDDHRGA